MTNPIFSEEIFVEIFSRLPQKSIGKFECLSKYWLSFLSTPEFIKLCLNHFGNLIMITHTHSLHLLLSTPLINDNAVSHKLDLPGSWTRVVGSCNGLVLLKNKECELFLVNPVTCSMFKIPDFDLALDKNESTVIMHGFGYDASTSDYKVVTISYDSGGTDTFVDVYSVKKGVWKRVHSFNYNGFVPENNPKSVVFVNGAIHWLISRQPRSLSLIVAFDLANEVFYRVSAPFLVKSRRKRLFVRGGRLCVAGTFTNDRGEVWTVEVYGSVESWKRVVKTEDGEWSGVRPLCFVEEDLLMLETAEGRLAVYDVKETAMKEFVVDGVPNYCKDAYALADNLAFLVEKTKDLVGSGITFFFS